MKFTQVGRNSPDIIEGEPQLRGFARFARKNIYCVKIFALEGTVFMTSNHQQVPTIPAL
jgi:hypothetical protein